MDFLLLLIELFSLDVTPEVLRANIGAKSEISLQRFIVGVRKWYVCPFVTLERPQSDIVELKETCMVTIDCSVISEPYMCIEYRDNSSMSRWLSVSEENG